MLPSDGKTKQKAEPSAETEAVSDLSGPPTLRLLRFVVNREVMMYLIVGGFTTLVNVGVFTVLSYFIGHRRWWLSNVPAIIIAILVAYVLNRLLVFRSHGPVIKEMYRFFSSRILISLVFEYGAMFLLYNVIGLTLLIPLMRWELSVSKVLSQFFVVVGNYLVSKFYIFAEVGNK